jgi:hypothetical protein
MSDMAIASLKCEDFNSARIKAILFYIALYCWKLTWYKLSLEFHYAPNLSLLHYLFRLFHLSKYYLFQNKVDFVSVINAKITVMRTTISSFSWFLTLNYSMSYQTLSSSVSFNSSLQLFCILIFTHSIWTCLT